jgi:ABC-type branched-subunit amino acid transport system permease subunit
MPVRAQQIRITLALMVLGAAAGSVVATGILAAASIANNGFTWSDLGMSANIGWHDTRIINGSLPAITFPWTLLLGAVGASLVAVLVGIGALRVRGLLLAISTLAFAIASQVYLFDRPFFTAGRSTVQIPRADIGRR